MKSTFLGKDFFGDPLWPKEEHFQVDHSLKYQIKAKQHKRKSILLDEFNDFRNQQSYYFQGDQADQIDQTLQFQSSLVLADTKLAITNFKPSYEQNLQDQIKLESSCFSQSQESPSNYFFSENSIISSYSKEKDVKLEFSNLEQNSQGNQESKPVNKRKKYIKKDIKKGNVLNFKSNNEKKYMSKVSRKCMEMRNKKCIQLRNKKCFQLSKKPEEQIHSQPFQPLVHSSLIQSSILSKLSLLPASSKYKILNSYQKQYLVYLTLQSSTCQVARHFNISVNNLCRWKKGCQRKAGAGRKITNQQLEKEMISFVKNMVKEKTNITRKIIQQRAREFSQDKTFKASKGWFQRFFNRNADIFVPQENILSTQRNSTKGPQYYQLNQSLHQQLNRYQQQHNHLMDRQVKIQEEPKVKNLKNVHL